MDRKFKAVVFAAENTVEFGEFELGPCGGEDIVVKTLFTMVSSGTELRVLAGHYGAKGKFPLIPGYSMVGEVVGLGCEVKGYRVGDLVSCRNPRPVPGINCQWGAQAGLHVSATVGEDCPVLLPAGRGPLDYVIAEVAAISFRGVEAADPRPGETAVVLGQGVIGAFSGVWLHARGCRVIVADVEDGRLERASRWGAAATVKISGPDAEARLKALCGNGADIVVEASGTSKGALLSHRLIRPGARRGVWPRLVMQANYLEEVGVNPFGFFPGEGVTILTPADRGVEDRRKVVEAIRRGAINPADFVQNLTPVADAPAAYARLRDDKDHNFSLAFDWRQ